MAKVLIFVEDLYEDMEFQYPKFRMKEAGFDVVVAGPKEKETYKGKHGVPAKTDISFEKVNVSEYQALIIPGGYCPDKLRGHPKAVEIVKKFHEEEKLIAFICHAGWLPISAGVIKGVKCTSWHTIKDDMINAGAKWEDKAVVQDNHFISSRSPDDLPYFCPAIINYLNESALARK